MTTTVCGVMITRNREPAMRSPTSRSLSNINTEIKLHAQLQGVVGTMCKQQASFILISECAVG